MILDYSQYVEVVAREADATAYPYYPSDADIDRIEPRLLTNFHQISRTVPPSCNSFLLDSLGENELTSLLKDRVALSIQ
jgi:hypothetical protein